MEKRIFILGIVCLFFLPFCKGQQEINYTMFMFNKLAINPAYAGSQEALRVSGHHRNQWTGLEGAPINYTLSAHSTVFSDRMGFGATFTNDQIGIVRENIFNFSYAYRIPLKDKKSTLSMGLSGMLQDKRLNWDQTNPLHISDPELPVVANVRMNPNFGVGVYYNSENYYLGASIPRLLPNTFYTYGSGLSNSRTLYFMGGFIKKLTRNIKLQPGILVTASGNAPFDMDMNASLVFLDRFWVGLSYRLQDSANAIFQFQASEQLKFAFAFDFTLSELTQYAPATFEIMAQYTMKKSTGQVENIRFF